MDPTGTDRRRHPHPPGAPGAAADDARRRAEPTVVEGPWGIASTVPNPTSLADQAELDSLLDKIAATGMDSLSGDEKRRLNDLSKKLRKR